MAAQGLADLAPTQHHSASAARVSKSAMRVRAGAAAQRRGSLPTRLHCAFSSCDDAGQPCSPCGTLLRWLLQDTPRRLGSPPAALPLWLGATWRW